MDLMEETETYSSDEELNGFFNLLGELPTISIKRNDPCLCGSGKKYKKCCLNRNTHSSSEDRVESFEITHHALTPEESKNNFPSFSQEDGELITTLYRDLHEHPEMVDSESCDYFKQLHALHIKYPDHPTILNYIGSGYQHLGLLDKVKETVKESYEKFPDYLFAQIAMANILLADGFPEKAIEVLKGAYTLKTLYPDRNVFHLSEVRAFEYFMVRYFCMIKDIKQAETHLQIMEKVLDEDDDLLQDVKKVWRHAKRIYNFKSYMSQLIGLG